MAKLTQEQFNDILSEHEKWIDGDGGKRADLSFCDLRDSDLRGSNLRDSDLYGACLRGACLRGADLRGSNLYGADLRDSDLRGADLYGACLRGADLRGADLRGADLYGADLYGANLYGADLRDSDLRGADLYGAIGNSEEIKTIMVFDVYHINYTKDRLQIGCENHAISEWREFDDRRILEMEGKKALKFWRECRDYIFMTIDKFPAE